MKASEAIGELSAALSKAQSELAPAKLNAKNPFFNSTYADLASVWTACRNALSKNGLSVAQGTDVGDKSVIVETRLMHSSGQWLEGTLSMPLEKSTPQAVGSALTYARRYALAAMVGVAPEGDDDDAEGAERRQAEKQAPQEPIDKLAFDGAKAILESLETQEEVKNFMGSVAKSEDNQATKDAIKKVATELWKQLPAATAS